MDDILLMLPGPTTVDPRVLQAMAKDVVNHRGDEFGEIYTETTKLMSKTFQTKHDSYIITGSGSCNCQHHPKRGEGFKRSRRKIR